MFKTYRKFTGLILTSAFATIMLFGLNTGMNMRQDSTMSGCMFDQSTACPMDYQEHINHWQQTFTATHPTQNTMLTLLIIVAINSGALFFSSWLNWQRYAQEEYFISQSVYKQRKIIAKLSDHILQALSKGKLNPQLYNFSHTTA